jgi:hypothetical protein
VTTDDGGSENQIGGPPPVLLAALGAALLIAIGLVAAFASLRGDAPAEPATERPATAKTVTTDDRVLLLVYVGGSGFGRVQIAPSDVSCNAACEYKFTQGARVTATVDPASGSTFESWGDACNGKKRCSFVMDRPRTLSATFLDAAAIEPLCEGVAPADRDPTCPPDVGTSTTEPIVPGPDCEDARDNDNDGLTDTEQDPDCETSGNEAGTTEPPDGTSPPSDTPPPPPSSIAPNECADGEDNDGDGLTDRAQDPDCEKGRSESG